MPAVSSLSPREVVPDDPPSCRCGAPLFRENTACLSCGAFVGFLPEHNLLTAFHPSPEGGWTPATSGKAPPGSRWRPCEHRDGPHGCNWMVPADGRAASCLSCRLTRTRPDLTLEGAPERWARTERPKRQVVGQLLRLRVPVRSKLDAPDGVCFDLLEPPPDGGSLLTGHLDGVITINQREANDSSREAMKEQMRESYRTLAGHIRHELAHYYWGLLREDAGWLRGFRAMFGDETADYGEALRAHHANGAPADWSFRFISAYASCHPWEDWAETFAHYLHIEEGLHTALQLGVDPDRLRVRINPFDPGLLADAAAPEARDGFIRKINNWIRLSLTANEINVSLGHGHAYPFVLNPTVVRKLWHVHTSLRRLRDT